MSNDWTEEYWAIMEPEDKHPDPIDGQYPCRCCLQKYLPAAIQKAEGRE